MSAPLSLRAFAKRVGVSHVAVGKAVKSGRLKASIRLVNGRPEIADGDLAEREWVENASQAPSPAAPPRNRVVTRLPAPSAAAATDDVVDDPSDEPELRADDASTLTLAEAQRQLTIERTKKLQLERDVAEGRLVAKAVVTKEAFEAERIIRESLLNLPARIAGELAADSDTASVHRRLDTALREVLDATADALLAAMQ